MAKVERSQREEIALGTTLVGFLFSAILYGLFLSQVYMYYKRFPRDSIGVKLLPSNSDVSSGDSPLSASLIPQVEPAISMTISILAEGSDFLRLRGPLSDVLTFRIGFFIYRVWMLNCQRTFLTGLLTILAATHFGLSFFLNLDPGPRKYLNSL
ncbi:hypothetical protein PM082_012372 [Marasmius tenuissimus]|nr:hypothetical protein PM082_012372 [Marasmius tenuissimus]